MLFRAPSIKIMKTNRYCVFCSSIPLTVKHSNGSSNSKGRKVLKTWESSCMKSLAVFLSLADDNENLNLPNITLCSQCQLIVWEIDINVRLLHKIHRKLKALKDVLKLKLDNATKSTDDRRTKGSEDCKIQNESCSNVVQQLRKRLLFASDLQCNCCPAVSCPNRMKIFDDFDDEKNASKLIPIHDDFVVCSHLKGTVKKQHSNKFSSTSSPCKPYSDYCETPSKIAKHSSCDENQSSNIPDPVCNRNSSCLATATVIKSIDDFESLTSKNKGRNSRNRSVEKFSKKNTEKDSLSAKNTEHVSHPNSFKKTVYHCSQCSFKGLSENKIILHRRKVHEGDSTPHRCSHCSESFRLWSELRVHTRKSHPMKIPCVLCSKVFSNEATYHTHLQNIHKNDKNHRFRCTICEARFTEKEMLRKHFDLHSIAQSVDGAVPFKCVICSIEFTNSIDLKRHVKLEHSLTKPLKCDSCPKLFTSLLSLKEHHRLHTEPEKLPTCHICALVCTSKSKLKQHMNTHSTEKRFVCDVCGKAYRDKRVLNYHKKRHLDQLPYPCHLCEKSFPSSGMLKVHEEIHSGKRSWMCHNCGKAFVTKHNLNQHIRKCESKKQSKEGKTQSSNDYKRSLSQNEIVNYLGMSGSNTATAILNADGTLTLLTKLEDGSLAVPTSVTEEMITSTDTSEEVIVQNERSFCDTCVEPERFDIHGTQARLVDMEMEGEENQDLKNPSSRIKIIFGRNDCSSSEKMVHFESI